MKALAQMSPSYEDLSPVDQRQFFLDDLVLSTSEDLAKCPVNAIDTIRISTLEQLCRAEGADQAGWILFREGSGIMESLATTPNDHLLGTVTHAYSDKLSWCKSRLLGGQPVHLKDLAEFPRHAERDRSYLERFGVQSVTLVRIDAGESDRGIVALLSLKKPSPWSKVLVRQCKLIGNIFLGAHVRKVTHQQKELSEANFRELFRSASVGMALEDSAGGLMYVNEALCNMLGYTEREMLAMRCTDITHPADREREAVLFGQLSRKERQGYQIEKRFLHRTGKILWGKVNVAILRECSNGPTLVLGIVEDITAQRSTIQKLTTSKMEVQSLASRLIMSQEHERQRIARELHDDIGQRLSLVTSELHVLKEAGASDDPSRLATIQSLSEELDALVTDLHGLSHRLHSSKLAHLGIRSALRDLCAQLGRSGLHVDLNVGEEVELLPQEISLCLYRIAQEALSNTLKHSGVNYAAVTLSKTTDCYYMKIKDSGLGFNPDAGSEGLGLISMKERLNPFNGRFTVNSTRHKGTEIEIMVPLRESRKTRRGMSIHNQELPSFQ